MRDHIERVGDIGRGQKLLDELRHAVERRRKILRHQRMAEAGQVRRDAAKMRAEPAGDGLPHHAAIGIAVQQQHRRSCAPFGDMDGSVADAHVARGRRCAFTFGHGRTSPRRGRNSIAGNESGRRHVIIAELSPLALRSLFPPSEMSSIGLRRRVFARRTSKT
jgi:hypothetical protein